MKGSMSNKKAAAILGGVGAAAILGGFAAFYDSDGDNTPDYYEVMCPDDIYQDGLAAIWGICKSRYQAERNLDLIDKVTDLITGN